LRCSAAWITPEKIELVAGPAGFDVRPARDVILQLVDIVRDPAPRFIAPEVVRQVDFDGLTHPCDVARRSALFKAAQESMTWP
jgi:hypothetical protein